MDIPKSYIDDFPVFFTFNSCDFHHCPGLPHVSYLSIHNISHFKDIRSESIRLDRNYSHFSINDYIAGGSRVNISSRYDCSRARFKLLCCSDNFSWENKTSDFKVFPRCLYFARSPGVRCIHSLPWSFLWIRESPFFTLVSPELVLRRCLLYTSPSPRDGLLSRMPSS